MAKPWLLLLDEPSLGLALQMIDTVFDLIADRATVLANGEVVLAGTAKQLTTSDLVRQAYLGA